MFSKHKRGCRALRDHSHFQQRQIVDIPNHTFHKDTAGRVQGSNKAYEEFTGCTKKDNSGKTDFETFPEDLAYEALFRERGAEDTVHCSGISECTQAERRLRAANQKLLDIIDFLPDATFAIDRDGRVIAWNRAIEEMTGVCKKDMLGRDDYAYSVPFYGVKRPILIDLIFLENSGFEPQYEYTERKESTIYGEAFTPCVYNGKGAIMWGKASPLFDSDGNLIGAIESIRDITDRKKAEDQLRSLNQQLEDIIEFLPDATLVINKERKVIAWNKAIEEMTGVKKEEMIGRGNYAYAVPFYGEPRPILIDLVLKPQKEFEDKYDYIIRNGGTLITETDVPFTYKGKGAVLWGIATLLLDSDGNVIGAIESIRDITDHKKTVEALRLSEQRFSKIFNNSPSLMFISTVEEGSFIEVNDRFLRVTGYSREEVIGRTVSDISFWVKPDRAEVINSLQEKGMVNNLECIFREKSGEVYIGLYSAEKVYFNGEEFILSVVNDISERKRLEEEMARLERLNLIGEMAAGIGHEIRNPMTTVRGFLQMLGEKKECSNFREYYNLMIDELDRANSIITEYLSLAKNKAVSKQYHNLNQILNALFPLIQADAMRTDMYVHMELENIPDLLLDEKEIRQLILNMVRNGLEVMSPGKNITIRTFVKGDEVVLAIQDQGKGIKKDDLEKLGTPFFTTKDHGTGLGLAVCYSIAARHNGTVRVETGSDGTTFYVCFAVN